MYCFFSIYHPFLAKAANEEGNDFSQKPQQWYHKSQALVINNTQPTSAGVSWKRIFSPLALIQGLSC
jgi:hypothetical protein